MKHFFATALSVLAVAISISAVAQNSSPAQVPALFTKVYIPKGFDSNDHVQILGEGTFRNTCYRHANTTVKIDEAQKTISLGPVAYEYSGFCLQVILPFERVVDIGLLKAGLWKVVQGSDSSTVGEIAVTPALIDSADDYLYAPVSQAFLKQHNGDVEIVVTGEFSNSCLSLDTVKVDVQADVVVVQPIAKFDQALKCQNGQFAFSKIVHLSGVKAGRYLLHVRSMNGNAVNSLVSVH